MIRALAVLLAPLAFALAFALPAAAHRLKVFAAVTGPEVGGYAFFIGNGRPRGASWRATDGAGTELAAGTTDGEGRFAFALPAGFAADLSITVDTHDGHVAGLTLPAARFGGAPASPSPALSDPARPNPVRPDPARAPGEADLPALIEAAVQRQVAPLLDRIEQMDARLRLTDALSGIFLILGLAGAVLWARGRRP